MTPHSLEVMDDEQLVLAAKLGESIAFVELRRRHADKILRSTYRIVKNWEDSEDVLQESLLKAYMHLSKFEGRSSFSSWLTRIAINSALMLLRSKRNVCELSITSSFDDLDSGTTWEPQDVRETQERSYQQKEMGELLNRAVLRLPQGTQEVLDHFVQGCTNREIAQRLGISEPAVKSRLARARTALRRSPALKSTCATNLRDMRCTPDSTNLPGTTTPIRL
jgi:RNA polymerase sigma-70 factor, ECF subfamily